MKFTITYKDPDGIYEQFRQVSEDTGQDYNLLYNFANKWLDGEYVTIEFDTGQDTAKVIK